MIIARIRAVNRAGESTNPIHFDADAVRLGLRGGWVGGPTLLGYLAQAAEQKWGAAWLRTGGMAVRFRAPVHDGDELQLVRDDDQPVGTTAQLVNADGVVCSAADLLPPGSPGDDLWSEDPAGDRAAPEIPDPGARPPLTFATLSRLPALTSITIESDDTDDVDGTGDHVVDRGAPVPLATLVGVSIDIMYATFRRPVGPRILTGIRTRQFSEARRGVPLQARGRILEAWRHKDRTYATNGVLVSQGDRPVVALQNTTIWEMP